MRSTIPEEALKVNHSRDNSRPRAKPEAGEPGKSRGRHRAEQEEQVVGCVNLRGAGPFPRLGMSGHMLR